MLILMQSCRLQSGAIYMMRCLGACLGRKHTICCFQPVFNMVRLFLEFENGTTSLPVQVPNNPRKRMISAGGETVYFWMGSFVNGN